METQAFNQLILKTAFCCMACDGHLDKREVQLIRKLHQEEKIFGSTDLNLKLDSLVEAINKHGMQFIHDYFSELALAKLSLVEELKLIETAIHTIKADEKIEYSEIKFFKVIRSKLKIANEEILQHHPEFEEYLEEDILPESYLAGLQGYFLESFELPRFNFVDQNLNDD